jgi:protein-S-isoprenylcysteine O-methyltransferase Ste14
MGSVMQLFQIVLLVYLLLFVSILLLSMLFIKAKGADPKGNTTDYSLLAKLSSLFTGLWAVVVVLYIIWGDSFNWFYAIRFLDLLAVKILGASLMGIALIINLLGMWALGKNFRVGIPTDTTELITSGIFRFTRNPIVLSTFLFIAGSFFIVPNILMLCLTVGNVITLHKKVLDEEFFLADYFGQAWLDYCDKTGRYLLKI